MEAEPSSERDLGVSQRATIYPPNVKGWAVIVGISRYEHGAWNLEFADRDAKQLADLVRAPAGGRFENVQLLINEEATHSALNKALKSFLKQPDKEDIVLLFFACHGAPDPDRPENIYLLTHDTDPQDISGTALPMREIDLALRETLRAERVVILADTCHSGDIALGIGRRHAIDQSAVVNKYLKDLSQARGGVALLTSAAANESSREGKQWGEGHGVFTHFLLEGMRGQADGYGGQPRDGKVGARELFEYVRDMVKKETGDGQHPTIGSDAFDPALPMAICGEVDAQEHHRLGSGLEQLAARLNEPMRFRAAAVHYAEAVQFAGKSESLFAEAELGWGRSLVRAGELDEGIRILTRLIEREKETAPAHTYLWLGVAQAKRHLRKEAAVTLKEFVQRAPQDEAAPWAERYGSWLTAKQTSKRYALLIGINQYASTTMPRLNGCVNDVRLMRETLIKRFGMEEANVTTLVDEDATRGRILGALADIRAKTMPADQVMVFYSGLSSTLWDPMPWRAAFVPEPEVGSARALMVAPPVPVGGIEAFDLPTPRNVYLVVHDTAWHGSYLENGISPEELHHGLTAIAAQLKILVLDTRPRSQFIELAEDHGDYTVLLASDSARSPGEAEAEINGVRQTAGLFTAALVTQLITSAKPESATCGALLARAIAYMREQEQQQTPLLIGDPARPFFAGEDIFLHGFELAQRRSYAELSPRTVAWSYCQFSRQFDFSFPELFYRLGLALGEKGLYEQASKALEKALAQKKELAQKMGPEALLALVEAQIGTGSYCDLLQTVNRLATRRRYALIVGVSKYSASEIAPATGAVDDALMMQQMLIKQLGFAPEDITLLRDGEATREVVLAQLRRLAEKAVQEPALFFFAGNGSYQQYRKSLGEGMADSTPSLLSADSRSNGVIDLSLVELAEICRGSANLVAVLDAWRSTASGPSGMVTMDGMVSATRGSLPRIIEKRIFLGGLTIYPKYSFVSMTQGLIGAMTALNRKRPTYRDWLDAAKQYMDSRYMDATGGKRAQMPEEPFEVKGKLLDEPIFESVTARDEVLRQIKLMDQAPLDELMQSLQRQIDQRDQQGDTYPRGRLNLGVTCAATGNLEKGADALDRAVSLYSDPSIMEKEKAHDPLADKWFQESRYHLGRVLYESKQKLGRAVNELERVVERDPQDARALYYYGQAIRAMVERETLSKAEEVLQRYLTSGAPLGHEDEVREFLGSRKNALEVARRRARDGSVGGGTAPADAAELDPGATGRADALHRSHADHDPRRPQSHGRRLSGHAAPDQRRRPIRLPPKL